jgi:hypothetical protein
MPVIVAFDRYTWRLLNMEKEVNKRISLLVMLSLHAMSLFAQENGQELEVQERIAKAEHESELKALDAIREAKPVVTEYTLTPGQVEMVVELEPNNYGFRSRNFRHTIGADFDLLFRGRAMLRYDHRFFEYFSVAFHAGVDWSQVSLYNQFRQQLTKPAPKQMSVLGGVSGKWRITEWYLHSSIFLEPSVLAGYMWQQLLEQKTTHIRVMPGLFAGVDTVFDSGVALQFKIGVEFPIDFAAKNPVSTLVEPLALFGIGLAI